MDAICVVFLVFLDRSGPMWDRSRALTEQSEWTRHVQYMDGLVD